MKSQVCSYCNRILLFSAALTWLKYGWTWNRNGNALEQWLKQNLSYQSYLEVWSSLISNFMKYLIINWWSLYMNWGEKIAGVITYYILPNVMHLEEPQFRCFCKSDPKLSTGDKSKSGRTIIYSQPTRPHPNAWQPPLHPSLNEHAQKGKESKKSSTENKRRTSLSITIASLAVSLSWWS